MNGFVQILDKKDEFLWFVDEKNNVLIKRRSKNSRAYKI
jgi:hypothetical protein